MDHLARRHHPACAPVSKSGVDFGGQPGTVHMGKGQLSVQCGDGAIDVLRLQPQGKPAMDVKSFLNGLRSPLRILGS